MVQGPEPGLGSLLPTTLLARRQYPDVMSDSGKEEEERLQLWGDMLCSRHVGAGGLLCSLLPSNLFWQA